MCHLCILAVSSGRVIQTWAGWRGPKAPGRHMFPVPRQALCWDHLLRLPFPFSPCHPSPDPLLLLPFLSALHLGASTACVLAAAVRAVLTPCYAHTGTVASVHPNSLGVQDLEISKSSSDLLRLNHLTSPKLRVLMLKWDPSTLPPPPPTGCAPPVYLGEAHKLLIPLQTILLFLPRRVHQLSSPHRWPECSLFPLC